MRAWDLWYFNDLDHRFGDDWPGQIQAQLAGHTLHYFSKVGDLVFDPMAGGALSRICVLRSEESAGHLIWSIALTHGRLCGAPHNRPYVRQVIYRYLDCGILYNGFARIRCGDCGHEVLLAYEVDPLTCPGAGAQWLL